MDITTPRVHLTIVVGRDQVIDGGCHENRGKAREAFDWKRRLLYQAIDMYAPCGVDCKHEITID